MLTSVKFESEKFSLECGYSSGMGEKRRQDTSVTISPLRNFPIPAVSAKSQQYLRTLGLS